MIEKKRLAIITTHPIQYNAPLFTLLAQRSVVQIKVFYTWGATVLQNKFDPGFGKIIEWDLPLLEGYEYEFVENTALHKGSDHFKGIINPGLTLAIEKYRADAVLIYGWPFLSHLKAMRYFKNKIPILFRGDSTLLDEERGIKKILRSFFLRWVYRNVNYALYAGKNNYDYFINAGLVKRQLIFAPHAVHNSRFSQLDTTSAFLRERFQIAQQDFVFLYAGKLEAKKNVQLLIKAFIKAQFDLTTHLLITGNGPLEIDLKEQAGNNVNIHFLDFQNQGEMPAVYQSCDVFVLPSKGPGETWGLAINEAMAAGKTIIASSKCGCTADLVIEGKTGFVFQSGDVNELSYRLRWCEENKAAVKAMGIFAAEKIKDFSIEKVALAIEHTVAK